MKMNNFTFTLLGLVMCFLSLSDVNAIYLYPNVAGGEGHSVFLGAGGKIWMTGKNDAGQLGNISDEKCMLHNNIEVSCTTIVKPLIQQVMIEDDVKAVYSAFNQTMVLTKNGDVYALGANNSGQLGDGTNGNKRTLTKVKGLSNVKMVAMGRNHTLFLMEDGSVKAVGYNNSGQLCNGSKSDAMEVIDVDIKDIMYISAGHNHSLFLSVDGKVYACGDNTYGQLGLEKLGLGNDNITSIPILIENLEEVKNITAGGNHSLFLMKDGTVKGVGANYKGQLGIGTIENTNKVTQVKEVENPVIITAGNYFSAFLFADGTVKTVGANNFGQLGNKSSEDSNIPKNATIDDVAFINAGNEHILFVLKNGTVKSVGNNISGQLGNELTENSNIPIFVKNIIVRPYAFVRPPRRPVSDVIDTHRLFKVIDGEPNLRERLKIRREGQDLDFDEITGTGEDFTNSGESIVPDLYVGDIIETTDSGGVFFQMSQYHDILMDEDSELELFDMDEGLMHYMQNRGNIWYNFLHFDEEDNDENDDSNTGSDIFFNSSKLLCSNGNIWYGSGNKTRNTVYKISTKLMLLLVKGTYFNVSVDDNGNETVSMVDGHLEVEDINTGKKYELYTGQTLLATASGFDITDDSFKEDEACVVFCDVPTDSWYFNYVKNLKTKGIVNGKTSITYEPASNITRAEVLKVAMNIAGISMSSTASYIFEDVEKNAWYHNYISTAMLHGVVQGYGSVNGKEVFKPNDPVKRSEALKMLIKAQNIDIPQSYSSNFNDVDGVEWFAYYLQWAVDNNVIEGYDDDSFKPENYINRAEFAKIADVLMQHLGK